MAQSMLASGTMIGFVFTKDYAKSRAFYEEKLGFTFVSLDEYALVMKTGKNHIRIVKLPKYNPVQATILGWEVADVHAAVLWLNERGVKCEIYPFVQDQKLGIWTTPDGNKVAWFKDPDDNILSVSQH